LTCPHTSQQNSIAERKHRHIMEMGLTLLAQSGLSPKYWVDAFLTATFLINRLPSPVLQHESPFSKLFHHSPDYTSFRAFGCLCYPFLRPYANHKLSFRSKPCIFIGYGSNQNGYRCLNPATHKVFLSWNVIFDETQFPAKSPTFSLGSCKVTDSPGNFLVLLPSSFSHASNSSSPSLSPHQSVASQPIQPQNSTETPFSAASDSPPDSLEIPSSPTSSNESSSHQDTQPDSPSTLHQLPQPFLPPPSSTFHLLPLKYPLIVW
jgi:hypothetical protein